MNTNTNITTEAAKNAIIKSIGKYGWYPLNDYLELRNVILFGEREHDYVLGIDEMIPGEVIDNAKKMMYGDTIVSIRNCRMRKPNGRKYIWGWELSILPMGDGYVLGTPFTVMGKNYATLEEAITVVKECNEDIWNRSRDVYVTGDDDGVSKVVETFDWIGKKIAPNCYTFNN